MVGIVKCLRDFLDTYRPVTSEDNTINSVKASGKCFPKPKDIAGILHKADDWKLSFDSVDQNLAISTLQPDVLLILNREKRVVLIELTSPCEENMEARHTDKLEKYAPLCSAISHKGWKVDSLQWKLVQEDFARNLCDTFFENRDFCQD